jgi:8-amino-7-oxononanoate synthase
MKPTLRRQLAEQAAQRTTLGLVRRQRVVDGNRPHQQVLVDGRWLVNFSSNDYLGLAHDPEIAQVLAEQAASHGATASPLVCGHTRAHQALEAALADFSGFESAVLFPSGYQANLAVGQAMLSRGQNALADRLNHASLNDGMRLSGARIRRYRHADTDDLERTLKSNIDMIATDSVFSMDGDLAPLEPISRLADQHDIPVWLDDAHGFGVLGQSGRGALEHLKLNTHVVDVYVATLGKALGLAGAFVAGDRALIEHLVNTARPLIYSTATPPAVAAAARRALHKLATENWRREALGERIARFRQRCAEHQVPLNDSQTPIQIVPVGDNRQALALSEALEASGYLVVAIRPPTVPVGSARLRITLSSAHQPQDIERLARCLGSLIQQSRNSAYPQ